MALLLLPSSSHFCPNSSSLAQTQNLQAQTQELEQLLQQATNETQQGQPQQAIGTFQQALILAQQLHKEEAKGIALFGLGLNYFRIGKSGKSLDSLNEALPIFKAINNRLMTAFTLNGIGDIYRSIGQSKKALEFYSEALNIAETVDNPLVKASVLNNIGLAYFDTKQPQKALEFYNKALPIFRAAKDRAREATTLSNIGAVYVEVGLLQKALDFLNQSLPILREVGDRTVEATTLNNIGEAYNAIGQPQKALDFLNQASEIIRTLGNPSLEASALSNIGKVYGNLEQPQKALEFYNRALPILREVSNRPGEAITLNNIGEAYRTIGQPQKALEFYNQALPILREVGNRSGEAIALNNIGAVHVIIGQPQKALEFYNQALRINTEVGNRFGEVITLNNIGLVYHFSEPKKAIANWEQAAKLTLEIRKGLIRGDRQNFLNEYATHAIALTDLLISQKLPDRAYEWVNLSATFDLADYSRLLNAKVASPESQKQIDQWLQQTQQLQFLYQRIKDNFSEELAKQIRELEAQVSKLADTISRRYPETAELFETTPTDIAHFRANIPDGTIIIHPVLLTNVSQVPNTIALFVLTKDKLTATKIPINPSDFDYLLRKTEEQLTNRQDDNFLGGLEQLYDILIRPVEAQIQATKTTQLSIITTGKLRHLPFETLYDQKTNQYLIQKYPINYLTRLSSHALATKANSTTQKRILALGNPVPQEPYNLSYAETEVKNITSIFPGSEAFIQNQATLDMFKSQALRFSFLHLATHGCFTLQGCCLGSAEECEKSHRIDLQPNTILFANRQSLNIADAALLGLQSVDLITLSACQTALQTNSNGEEIAGLAYLFERAGAKATIASLWSADDKTTQEIMVQFYTNLKNGMNKSEALRQAKLSQIDSQPFFWAPFVLIGDPR